MQESELRDILLKYVAGDCTEEEQAVVETWYLQLPLDEEGLSTEVLEAAVDRVASRLPVIKSPVRRIRPVRWWAAASIIAVVLSTGLYLWFNNKRASADDVQMASVKIIPPGRDGAVLTLSNGNKMVLDSLGSGVIAMQGSTKVRLQDGQLSYDQAVSSIQKEAALNNIMSTPKGRQFRLVLPDGTKVWLNAASSISYPTAFTGTERKVAVTGEAYFEVAHDQKMPFIVQINTSMAVQVLGTHFDINAYADEPWINTTLLEGSIKMRQGNDQYLLQPGQQARWDKQSNKVSIQPGVDEEDILAWKNGFFYFHHSDLPTVMRQLERWYDISVEYSGQIPAMQFGGKIPRNANADEVLRSLEESKVHFKIEGKKIIVTP